MRIDRFQFAQDLAVQTGKHLLTYYQDVTVKANLASSLKDDASVLTEADLEADRLLTQAIRAAYPQDCVMSEEQDHTYPAHAPDTWIIDPIDGTTNFALGVHYWGVSIGWVHQGQPEIGVVYFPAINELYAAQKGRGAFFNGEKFTTPPFNPERPAQLFVRDSRMYEHFRGKLRIHGRILGAATYNFCAVARGIASAGMETTPKIWDVAAVWLIFHEAGAVSHHFAQAPFPLIPGTNYEKLDFPTLMAANEVLLARGRELIIPK